MSQQAAAGSGPLSGLRILDFTHVLSGPWCTQVLGDLGAEVIKVERPDGGEAMRSNPPFYPDGTSHYFVANNRNKCSLAVDLKTEQGRQIALDLAAASDIVVENFRPGVMDRLGIGFGRLSAVNPRLIMLSVSAYGQTGPWAEQPGYDLVTQARSGLMALTGERGGPPTKLGVPMADIGAGLWGAVGVLAALRVRDNGPQHIDLSLLEGSLGMLSYLGQLALLNGTTPDRWGTSHHRVVPYGRYPAKDGDIILTLHQAGSWELFCSVAGRTDLAADPRFTTAELRLAHREELEADLTELLATRTRAEWEEILVPAGVSFGPVLDINEALDQEQVQARGVLRTMDHPTAGVVEVIGGPLRIDGRIPPMEPAPLLGQHSLAVLRDVLGRSGKEIDQLVRDGVVTFAVPSAVQTTGESGVESAVKSAVIPAPEST